MSKAALKPSVISLSDAFGPLVVRGDGIEVEFKDGRVIVYSGNVEFSEHKNTHKASASPAALKIGDVVQDGPNKGWVYCETTKREPFLVAPKDSGVMQWRAAMDFAARENSALPDREQLNAMHEARNTGALKDTFNTTESITAGWYWSSSQATKFYAWGQRFSDGHQVNHDKDHASSLRCVRRYSVI